MTISKFKIVLKWLFGGIGSVVDYLLDVVNSALSKIDPSRKEQVQAVLNVAEKALGILGVIKAFIPVKWQTAFDKTVFAMTELCVCLEDLQLTKEELSGCQASFAAAVAAWKSPDDETCVDCIPVDSL